MKFDLISLFSGGLIGSLGIMISKFLYDRFNVYKIITGRADEFGYNLGIFTGKNIMKIPDREAQLKLAKLADSSTDNLDEGFDRGLKEIVKY